MAAENEKTLLKHESFVGIPAVGLHLPFNMASCSDPTTPLFSISQTPTTLTVRIRAPHSRPRDIEVNADGHDFHFHCAPYLLHLRFEHPTYLPEPHHLDITPAIPHTSYDFDTGVAEVTLRKTEPGTQFEKLDLLSTIVGKESQHDVSKPEPFAAPSIQVLSSSVNRDCEAELEDSSDELVSSTRIISELNAEFASQTADISGIDVPLRELSLTRPSYGFASRYEAIFTVRCEDATQIVQLPNPDSTPVWRRPSLRKAAEDDKFDPDHYIADFLLEHEFQHVFEYSPRDRTGDVAGLHFLPKREYLPDVDLLAAADLTGILFASAYDERITSGERNVESAWTISRLSPSMSFLEQMKKPRDAALAAYRRSLVYPLYRNCKLSNIVLEDLKSLFDGDAETIRKRILNVLMELREKFEDDILLRLHCDLFIIDYCVWIQGVSDAIIERLSSDVKGITIEKHELEWGLDILEERARRMANGEDPDDPELGAVGNDIDASRQPVEGHVARIEPDNRIVITANSGVNASGLECIAVATKRLDPEPKAKYGPPQGSTTSSEYDSDSSCTTSSSEI